VADQTDIIEKIKNDFRRMESVYSNGMNDLRLTALANFSRMGFPTRKHEEWKYTDISPILKTTFSLPGSFPFETKKEEILARLNIKEDVILVVLENGRLNPLDTLSLPEGLEMKTIGEAKNSPSVQKHFSKYADMQHDAFSALNTAFLSEGLMIRIQPGHTIEKPLFIVNLSSPREEAVISHNRLLVVAEKNASARMAWITLSGSDAGDTFVNAVNEIVVEENANLEFNICQNENAKAYQVCNTYAYQLKDSKFTINTTTLGGSIVRNKLHIKLDGENCETHLYGLYVADDKQLMDNHTAVFHARPHSNSNQLYKGIIGGKAHGVFNGKIFVEKDAQKTNAYQSNKNILLSNDAVINAKPQLEIFADDVKCTHGATTGQMDEESLFYLRTRGINEVNAKALLNKAFASDILNKITIESLRESIARETDKKLIKANA
jgi:Fe-S cluster assembly protein SufD